MNEQDAFASFAKSVSKILERLDGINQAKSREQLRDFIRSETALSVFRDEVKKAKLG